MLQVFGFVTTPNNKSAVVQMDGFIVNADSKPASHQFVMSAFNSTTLPVLSTLATTYAVADHWHCSVRTVTLMLLLANTCARLELPRTGVLCASHLSHIHARSARAPRTRIGEIEVGYAARRERHHADTRCDLMPACAFAACSEFLMSGTSHGKVDNNFPTDGFPQVRAVPVQIYVNGAPPACG